MFACGGIQTKTRGDVCKETGRATERKENLKYRKVKRPRELGLIVILITDGMLKYREEPCPFLRDRKEVGVEGRSCC